jgi:hypothetical protein
MDSIADGRLCKIDHSGPALFKYPAWAAALVARGVSVRSRLQGVRLACGVCSFQFGLTSILFPLPHLPHFTGERNEGTSVSAGAQPRGGRRPDAPDPDFPRRLSRANFRPAKVYKDLAKVRAISTSAVITAGSSKAITKSVVATIKTVTTTRTRKLSPSINRRIGFAIMELMIAVKRHQLEG